MKWERMAAPTIDGRDGIVRGRGKGDGAGLGTARGSGADRENGRDEVDLERGGGVGTGETGEEEGVRGTRGDVGKWIESG